MQTSDGRQRWSLGTLKSKTSDYPLQTIACIKVLTLYVNLVIMYFAFVSVIHIIYPKWRPLNYLRSGYNCGYRNIPTCLRRQKRQKNIIFNVLQVKLIHLCVPYHHYKTYDVLGSQNNQRFHVTLSVSKPSPDSNSGNGTLSQSASTSQAGSGHLMVVVLASALSIGLFIFLVVVIMVGKRVFESWQRRHYSRVDYLVNGMYN